MITIIDVCRIMGVEPTPELTWAVGAAVRDLWVERHGVLPEKELRPKTAGPGSHCFAIYPETMRDEIENIIAKHHTEAARQMTIFDIIESRAP